jgi:hypothetical protein
LVLHGDKKPTAIANNKLKTSSNTLPYSFIYSCLGISTAIANPLNAKAQNAMNFIEAIMDFAEKCKKPRQIWQLNQQKRWMFFC